MSVLSSCRLVFFTTARNASRYRNDDDIEIQDRWDTKTLDDIVILRYYNTRKAIVCNNAEYQDVKWIQVNSLLQPTPVISKTTRERVGISINLELLFVGQISSDQVSKFTIRTINCAIQLWLSARRCLVAEQRIWKTTQCVLCDLFTTNVFISGVNEVAGGLRHPGWLPKSVPV